ncbi:TPA: hypothetical protein ACTURP_003972, partial [Legionella anisa]
AFFTVSQLGIANIEIIFVPQDSVTTSLHFIMLRSFLLENIKSHTLNQGQKDEDQQVNTHSLKS